MFSPIHHVSSRESSIDSFASRPNVEPDCDARTSLKEGKAKAYGGSYSGFTPSYDSISTPRLSGFNTLALKSVSGSSVAGPLNNATEANRYGSMLPRPA